MNTQSIKKLEPEDETLDIEAKLEIMKGLNEKKNQCQKRHSSAQQLKLDLFGAKNLALLFQNDPSYGIKPLDVQKEHDKLSFHLPGMPSELDFVSSVRYHLDDFRDRIDKQHKLYDEHMNSTERYMSKVMEHYGEPIKQFRELKAKKGKRKTEDEKAAQNSQINVAPKKPHADPQCNADKQTTDRRSVKPKDRVSRPEEPPSATAAPNIRKRPRNDIQGMPTQVRKVGSKRIVVPQGEENKLNQPKTTARQRDSKAQRKGASTANPTPAKAKPATVLTPVKPIKKVQNANEAQGMKSSKLQPVDLPGDSVPRFVEAALENTQADIETLGVFLGKIQDDCRYVTTLYLPPQEGTRDSCQSTDDLALVTFCQANHLQQLGWIHTHPQFDVFYSAIDAHTQAYIQKGNPEYFGTVYSANKGANEYKHLRLPDKHVNRIFKCKKTGFHEHTGITRDDLVEECSHLKETNRKVMVVDHRFNVCARDESNVSQLDAPKSDTGRVVQKGQSLQHKTQLAEARAVENTHVPEIVEKCKEETCPTKENAEDHEKRNSDIKEQKGGADALGEPEAIVKEDVNTTKEMSCNRVYYEAAPRAEQAPSLLEKPKIECSKAIAHIDMQISASSNQFVASTSEQRVILRQINHQILHRFVRFEAAVRLCINRQTSLYLDDVFAAIKHGDHARIGLKEFQQLWHISEEHYSLFWISSGNKNGYTLLRHDRWLDDGAMLQRKYVFEIMLRRNKAVKEQLRLPLEQQDLNAIPLHPLPDKHEPILKWYEAIGRDPKKTDFEFNLSTGRLDPEQLRRMGHVKEAEELEKQNQKIARRAARKQKQAELEIQDKPQNVYRTRENINVEYNEYEELRRHAEFLQSKYPYTHSSWNVFGCDFGESYTLTSNKLDIEKIAEAEHVQHALAEFKDKPFADEKLLTYAQQMLIDIETLERAEATKRYKEIQRLINQLVEKGDQPLTESEQKAIDEASRRLIEHPEEMKWTKLIMRLAQMQIIHGDLEVVNFIEKRRLSLAFNLAASSPSYKASRSLEMIRELVGLLADAFHHKDKIHEYVERMVDFKFFYNPLKQKLKFALDGQIKAFRSSVTRRVLSFLTTHYVSQCISDEAGLEYKPFEIRFPYGMRARVNFAHYMSSDASSEYKTELRALFTEYRKLWTSIESLNKHLPNLFDNYNFQLQLEFAKSNMTPFHCEFARKVDDISRSRQEIWADIFRHQKCDPLPPEDDKTWMKMYDIRATALAKEHVLYQHAIRALGYEHGAKDKGKFFIREKVKHIWNEQERNWQMALVEALALIQIPQFRFQEAIDGSKSQHIEVTVLTDVYFKYDKEELVWKPRDNDKIIQESQILTAKDLAECDGRIFNKVSEAVPKLKLLRRPSKHGKHKLVDCKVCNKRMRQDDYDRHLRAKKNKACAVGHTK